MNVVALDTHNVVKELIAAGLTDDDRPASRGDFRAVLILVRMPH
jgi:hypothetical protein